MEKSNERKETEKKTDFFLDKTSAFQFQRKKEMALNVFEFLEQFMIDTFLMTLTQIEKTGSIRKDCISLENLIIKTHFRK